MSDLRSIMEDDPGRAARLVFLDTATARRLAAAWPSLEDADRDPVSFARWAEMAGVTEGQARVSGQPLLSSGVCEPDGTTDEIALQFIAARSARGGR